MKMTKYMQMALNLAKKGECLVSPNPLVGCVIEKNDQVIGVGWHKGVGHPHAEIEALQQAGDNASGANVYVNLEPCSHFGKTPPCADALIQANVNSVHIPFIDPNPLINGSGVVKLKQAGIKVYVGNAEKQAKQLNESFLHYIVNHTPFVIAKWAMTCDGKITMRNSNSPWITGIAARKHSHQLRRKVDAILVGVNTVIKDNPALTPHLIPNHSHKIPWRIILDPLGATPLASKILKSNPEKTLIITTPHSSVIWQRNIQLLGANLWSCEPDHENTFDLKVLMKKLGSLPISSLLVEGGANTLGEFFKAKLVNKVYTYIAPKLLNDSQALAPLVNSNTTKILDSINLSFSEIKKIGPDLLVISYPMEDG